MHINCFSCFKYSQKEDDDDINTARATAQPGDARACPPQPAVHAPFATSTEAKVNNQIDDANNVNSSDIKAKQFTFRELATATKNFRQECLIGECGFGRIYKGTIPPNGQVVTVKRLDKNSTQGNKEFLVEVLMLSLLRHSNLLNLVGYCADGDQRLLVYDYMPMGSVKEYLFDLGEGKKPLDWAKRMKIACGIAQGIEYLHDKANPQVIYRDLKCSNVMLDDDFNPKLSDHGLAKLGGNNKSHVTVMGSYGYCAPEYEKHGELTVKSDVYNFGVVLLELITGRGAVDTTKQADEQNLVKWAQPIFRDPKRYPEMADPRLNNSFPVKSLNQAVGVAAMCLQDEADVRPLISDVVAALTSLALIPSEVPDGVPKTKSTSRKESRRDQAYFSGESSDSSWSDSDESDDNNEIHDQQKDDCMDEEQGHQYEQNYTSIDNGSLIEKNQSIGSPYSRKHSNVRSDHGSMIEKNQSMSSHYSRESSNAGSDNLNVFEKNQSINSPYSRKSSNVGSDNVSSIEKNSSIGSHYSRKSSNAGSDNGIVIEKNQSIGSHYSRKSSNLGSHNGRMMEKNQSIGSNSWQGSINQGSDDGSVRSGHHIPNNEESEKELLL